MVFRFSYHLRSPRTAFNVGATAGSGGVATFYGQVIIGASGDGEGC
jgi:hypothetical protein